jgi:hypothetical protein
MLPPRTHRVLFHAPTAHPSLASIARILLAMASTTTHATPAYPLDSHHRAHSPRDGFDRTPRDSRPPSSPTQRRPSIVPLSSPNGTYPTAPTRATAFRSRPTPPRPPPAARAHVHAPLSSSAWTSRSSAPARGRIGAGCKRRAGGEGTRSSAGSVGAMGVVRPRAATAEKRKRPEKGPTHAADPRPAEAV